MNKDYCTSQELANHIGISRQALTRLRIKGYNFVAADKKIGHILFYKLERLPEIKERVRRHLAESRRNSRKRFIFF